MPYLRQPDKTEAVYTNTNKPGRSRYTLTEVNRGSNGLSREI